MREALSDLTSPVIRQPESSLKKEKGEKIEQENRND